MCIKCIKWDSKLRWKLIFYSVYFRVVRHFGSTAVMKIQNSHGNFLKRIKHQLTERSENTSVHREVWSGEGVFSGFSLDRLLGHVLLTSLCCDRCVFGEVRGGGQEVAGHGGSLIYCKDGACIFLSHLASLKARYWVKFLSLSAVFPAMAQLYQYV